MVEYVNPQGLRAEDPGPLNLDDAAGKGSRGLGTNPHTARGVRSCEWCNVAPMFAGVVIGVVVFGSLLGIYALIRTAPFYNETVTFDPTKDPNVWRWRCWKCGIEGIESRDAIESGGFNHTPDCPLASEE